MLALLLLAPLVAASTAKWCNQYLCLSASLAAEQVTYHVSARTADVGWLGIGTGYGMAGSRMVVLWHGTDDACLISERDGVSLLSFSSACFSLIIQQHGHAAPEINRNNTARLIPNTTTNTTQHLQCTYALPTTSHPFFTTQSPENPTAPMGMIWAYSAAPPSPPLEGRAGDALIRRHDAFGVFDLEFRSDSGTGKDADVPVVNDVEKAERRKKVMRAHAVGMVRCFLPSSNHWNEAD